MKGAITWPVAFEPHNRVGFTTETTGAHTVALYGLERFYPSIKDGFFWTFALFGVFTYETYDFVCGGNLATFVIGFIIWD